LTDRLVEDGGDVFGDDVRVVGVIHGDDDGVMGQLDVVMVSCG